MFRRSFVFLAITALPSQNGAVALAFPGAVITRMEHTLGDGAVARVKALSEREFKGNKVAAFEARRNGLLVGVAFFDTHRLRTQDETAMVAISSEGRILRVEVVAFREPQEYMAKEAWIRQFNGRALDQDLALGRAIKPLNGSPLTATALIDASRRSLALYQVLYGQAR